MLVIDKLAYTSKIRKKSPDLRAAFAISTLIVCIATNSVLMSVLILILMGYLTVKYSQISFCGYLKMMMWPMGFLSLSLIGIVFDFSTNQYDFFNLSIGSIFLAVSKANFIHGTKLFAVALSSVSCLYFLSLTTPMIDLMGVMKRAKIPSILVELTLLIYKFMFILLEMAENITISQNSRLGNVSFKSKLKSVSMMFSVILIRALGKANVLYSAMESRGYDGNIRVLWESEKATKKLKLGFFIYFIILVALSILFRYKSIL